MPQRNLAIELLRKLLSDEIKTRARRNVVQSRSFAEMLEATLGRYQARAIETAQVIEELIALAKELKEAQQRGDRLGLREEELAFYDALETNDSAVAVLGDDALRTIARELTETVRRNTTIDWTIKENVRANLRRLVRRVLRKHGYPPDMQERATQTVLEQAQLFSWEVSLDTSDSLVFDLETVEPFTRVPEAEARPFENSLPLYSLAAAAGAFSGTQEPEPEAWVEVGGFRPSPGMFVVARVVGESMNRRIPNGAHCVFRAPVEGTRQRKVLLVESRSIHDPEHGGHYTVKIYESSKDHDEGEWQHAEITLRPDSTDPRFEPIRLAPDSEDEIRVVAEVVAILA